MSEKETAGTPRGPCIVCGATGYSLSFGGPNICPSCDCGVDPQIAKLRREVAALTTQRDAAEKDRDENAVNGLKWKTRAEAAEAERDELQKRIGYTAVTQDSQCESPPLAMSQFATKEAYWEARCLAVESDAMTMALRLLGESDDTFAPETFEVMSRWRPKAMALVAGE